MFDRRLTMGVWGRFGLIAVLGVVLGGCAANSGKGAGMSAAMASRRQEMIDHPQSLKIFHGNGTPATWEEMVKDAAAADAVLIGETHEQPVGQAFEGAMFTDVLAKSPSAGAALEFIERDEQVHLDDYLLGVTDEAGFRKASNRTEGSYTPGHRAMVEACKTAKRPVVAANAPRRYVRLARTDGFDKLNALAEEQRRLFRIPEVLPEGKYRDEFFAMMKEPEKHEPANKPGKAAAAETKAAEPDADAAAKAKAKVEAMYRSQCMWDATMADSVARSVSGGVKPTVLVIGRFHTDFGGGTVQALKRYQPSARVLTISNVADWAGKDGLSPDDKDRADYVVYIGNFEDKHP